MNNLPPLFNRPNFPSNFRECYGGLVDVYWFHPTFSQSQYPPGQEGSEACTLICLLLAQKISERKLTVWDIDECNELIVTMAEAIAEGNKTHAWIMRQGLVSYAYLNTEEALQYGGDSLRTMKEWTFHVYEDDMRQGLYHHIQSFLRNWYKQPKAENLFMLLITSGRTILFIFQEASFKVTLFDSHTHNAGGYPPRGLVVAQSSFEDLESLCDWYVRRVIVSCYRIEPKQYELAFVYESKTDGSCGHGNSGCCCRRGL